MKFLSKLFCKKTKKASPQRVRVADGRYARKVKINYGGQQIGEYYTAPKSWKGYSDL
jgi:hypothetical protein